MINTFYLKDLKDKPLFFFKIFLSFLLLMDISINIFLFKSFTHFCFVFAFLIMYLSDIFIDLKINVKQFLYFQSASLIISLTLFMYGLNIFYTNIDYLYSFLPLLSTLFNFISVFNIKKSLFSYL